MKLPATVPSADLGVLLVWPRHQVAKAARLSMDSRSVQPGDLFVAWRGGPSHGLEFLPQVWHAGVAAVAYEPSPVLSLPADAARVFPIIVVVGQQDALPLDRRAAS